MKLYFAITLLFRWIFAGLTANPSRRAYYEYLWNLYFGRRLNPSDSKLESNRKKTLQPGSEEPRPLLIEG